MLKLVVAVLVVVAAGVGATLAVQSAPPSQTVTEATITPRAVPFGNPFQAPLPQPQAPVLAFYAAGGSFPLSPAGGNVLFGNGVLGGQVFLAELWTDTTTGFPKWVGYVTLMNAAYPTGGLPTLGVAAINSPPPTPFVLRGSVAGVPFEIR